MKALVLIDIQNDFMPGGALPVPNGDEIIPIVNQLQEKFELVIATQDWHPASHASFAVNHFGKEVYETIQLEGISQILWPVHCIQNTDGAAFHPDLQTEKIEAIFRKGTTPEIDSYSGFYDNAHLKSTGLAGYLKEKKVTELYFCGLAAEFCVLFSAKDAIAEGFECFYIEDATRALDADAFENAKQEITKLGGKVIPSTAV